MTGRRPWLVLAAATVVWLIARMQWFLGLHWDEIEFFRATRWMALGRLPYRDFWEHHTPLQWMVFAPVARLLGGGCGVAAILHMRWAQLALWAGIAALLMWWMRSLEVPPTLRIVALVVLGASSSFAGFALQYRVDVLANLLLLGGLTLIAQQRMWIPAGALLAASVLANIRLAPLVVIVTIAALFVPRWNARVLLTLIGGAAVAALFAAYLFATGSIDAALEGLVHYNVAAEQLGHTLEHNSVWAILFDPVRQFDVAGIILIAGGIAGAVIVLRTRARFIAIAAVAALLLQFQLTMHYGYHLQTFELMAVPLLAVALARLPLATTAAFAGVMLSLGISMVRGVSSLGEELQYQNEVMCAASALTKPADVVFDGVGYALERQPAYRYWFLPAGLQLLAARGAVAPYDLRELLQRPPGAIIYGVRTFTWFMHFPRLGAYVVRHYVPVYRNLWIPGLSARLDARNRQVSWLVPASGRYRIYASDVLAKHPWFESPLKVGLYNGPGAANLAIPLEQFRSATPLSWTIDGVAVTAESGILSLHRGNVLSVTSTAGGDVGLFIVEEGVRELFSAPSGSFEF